MARVHPWIRLRTSIGELNRTVALSVVGILGFLIIAIGASVTSVRTLFVIEANTEVLSGQLHPDARLTWWIPGAQLCAGKSARFVNPRNAPHDSAPTSCDGRATAITNFKGHIEIEGEANLRIERLGHGPLALSLHQVDGAAPFVVHAHQAGKRANQRIEPPLFLTFASPDALAHKGTPVSLPILARELAAGRLIDLRPVAQSPLLLGGTVTTMGEVVFGDSIYRARSTKLLQGDRVSVSESQQSIPGFARIDDRRGIHTVFRVEARRLSTSSFFGQTDQQSLTFIDEFRNDPFFTAIWSVIGALAALSAAVPLLEKRSGKRAAE